MRYGSIVLAVTVLLVQAGCCCLPQKEVVAARDRQAAGDAVLRHVVLAKFKDEATPEQIRAIERGFQALPDKIDVIQEFEWGMDINEPSRAEGFTHCIIMTFQSEEDLAAYLPHPVHQAFVAELRPLLDRLIVVDFWTEE